MAKKKYKSILGPKTDTFYSLLTIIKRIEGEKGENRFLSI